MTVDIGFANILLYLLVFVRLAGMLLFNPVLSRQSVPTTVRLGFVMFLTLMLAPMQPAQVAQNVASLDMVGYVLAIILELFIGFVYGFVFQIFYYLLFFVGDMMDTDIGLSMAKSFDPTTNMQTGFAATFITMMFTLYIFVTNSHLALIRLFALSFTSIHVGTFVLTTNIVTFVVQLFSQVFLLVVRLAAPIMVAEVVLQFCMGILMKFIPQISVFVINFQLRIALGLLLMYALAPFMGNFIDRYIDVIFQNLATATELMMQTA